MNFRFVTTMVPSAAAISRAPSFGAKTTTPIPTMLTATAMTDARLALLMFNVSGVVLASGRLNNLAHGMAR